MHWRNLQLSINDLIFKIRPFEKYAHGVICNSFERIFGRNFQTKCIGLNVFCKSFLQNVRAYLINHFEELQMGII
jgi:hypothetical protein